MNIEYSHRLGDRVVYELVRDTGQSSTVLSKQICPAV